MEKITLLKSTKIVKLIKDFPFLIDSLIEFNPALKMIKNPIAKRTIAKKFTLEDVSRIMEISLNELGKILKEDIEKQTDYVVEVDFGMSKENKDLSKVERKEILKSLVLELHEGGEVKELKIKFKNALADVEATEIAKMEQELINEGELTAEQITKLCDLHVGIFEDSLKTKDELKSTPGHPVHTYIEENKEALRIVEEYRKSPSLDLLLKLSEIEKHYTRLENQLFPKLETKEFMGPTQVMWAKHDEIRDLFKKQDKVDVEEILTGVED
ncbi:MAG: DUF438 domain-containing protein, partial [Candidatus Ranarchaeia archaeon]